jgi:hypothetical protein
VIGSRAVVTTASPERYAKQLVSHLGRKVEWTADGAAWTAELSGGTGRIETAPDAVVLVAAGPDDEAVTRIEHVLGSHLERFGARNELTVQWQRDAERG